MKKSSLVLAAVLAAGTAPAMAADYYAAPAPATCMDRVNAHYGQYDPHHQILAAPLWAGHAVLCHVFHHHDHYGPPVRG